ncbi:tRNA-dihydrouridine(16/17) synthase [NAD(P)(+)]-like isoform X2 [Bacillus rossius redtenbacheri]|uniref:tRNA-dihydrouridine(16/17) synthase [NAD(P)(+)]-like isoform X2 n=1 Tax=Bacillus rossius redtenbacheri TaxID=93214 RepID=UPI002FDD85A1
MLVTNNCVDVLTFLGWIYAVAAATKASASHNQKERAEMPARPEALQFWAESLGAPRFVVAPMVDASELAWRLLSRRHGAQLCYTPMLHSSVFVRDPKYRKEALASCVEDRPLIAQFCGNDAQVLLEAALLAEAHCDGIDINLGCPQAIARRGRYGAFLQDDWPLLTEMVGTLHKSLSVPVTCKIRVYEDVARTVQYAQMLEAAGCQMLTVHGRTRDQKGPLTGLANWEHIRAVREKVSIPVIANGNVQCLADVARCLDETRCHGVMSAEGNLYNPALFEGRNPPAWEMALEYLDLADRHPCPTSYVRGHLFKLFQHCLSLPENFDLRAELATGSDMSEFRRTVLQLRDRYLPYHEGDKFWASDTGYDLVQPPWICHSYVRPAPEEHLKKMVEKQNRNADVNQFGEETAEKENHGEGLLKKPREATADSPESKNLSKRKMKKLRRLKHKPNSVFHARRGVDKCVDCPNPVGSKCDYRLCKACCRTKCYVENKDCAGHRILVKTRREKAREYAAREGKAREPADSGEDRGEALPAATEKLGEHCDRAQRRLSQTGE